MTPAVSPEADRELTEAAVYYAREGSKEIGLAFIAEFERTLELLCIHPNIGAEWRNSRRRIPLRRFPYSVVYYTRPKMYFRVSGRMIIEVNRAQGS